MSRIRILSEQLANQIAAGEVVERPASVIKELVENSLDAGAGLIDIQIEGSGAGLLRVADNGAGMDGDDVLLCLERHATSKIREEGELAAIATLGFRGEAIPSIASVSWMTIVSRPQTQELGTRAEVRYGTLQAVHEHGCSRGTVIEVRHLFGNMPARKKFLKSARTEMHHVEEVVKNQALAHPRTGFTLKIDGRTALDYPPALDLMERVRQVFRYSGRLLALAATAAGEDEDMVLDGYLLLPETAPAGQARLRILVNDRPVQDAMIRHAVSEGLQGFLMKGFQPAGALHLAIGPEQVDVNVHPAKREIRFRRSEAVHRFIAARVAAAMRDYQQSLRSSLFAVPLPRTEEDQPLRWQEPAPLPSAPPLLPPAEPPGQRAAVPAPLNRPMRLTPPPPPLSRDATADWGPFASVRAADETFSGLTLIGQLFSLYLLGEREGQLLVIDQHAAHERLLYGQLRQGYLEARIPRQILLFPKTIELTTAQAETLENKGREVAALGFELAHFGELTYVVKAVPALVSQVEPAGLLADILDRLRGPIGEEPSRPVPRVIDDLLADMACKAAVKAGNRLEPREMLKLLAEMQGAEVFSHCPHGRPVVKTFSLQEVERWFHRHGG